MVSVKPAECLKKGVINFVTVGRSKVTFALDSIEVMGRSKNAYGMVLRVEVRLERTEKLEIVNIDSAFWKV